MVQEAVEKSPDAYLIYGDRSDRLEKEEGYPERAESLVKKKDPESAGKEMKQKR